MGGPAPAGPLSRAVSVPLTDRIFVSRAAARRYPPEGRLLPVGTGRLHVVEAGETRAGDPPVVLLHGASGNLRDWTTSILAPLSVRHRVVAFDRPGLGHSDPAPADPWSLDAQIAMLRAGLHALGHRRWLLVGHSYSGALVLRWALRHPDEVAGVLDLCGAAMDWGGGLGPHYTVAGTPLLGKLMARSAPLIAGPRMVARAVEAVFAPNPVPPAYGAEGGVELALRPRSFRLNALMMHRLRGQIASQAPDYPRIACPVEIVFGSEDRLVPPVIHARPLLDVLPDARLTMLDGVGHMPHHAAPGAVLAAVDRLARATLEA